ncbi:MAG: heparan-alpha-glucosaminide N-acetyltransferase domain-containing protein [Anaerolineales bacterium]|nr:heparan-alpha-glucosaminide N-acetyltransferase domain-containing protein [Anaerolineales bacterium]
MDAQMKSAAPRDASIDLLKGVGCLVMIVAHSSLNLGGYEVFKFWGGLAPVLFFSAVGVTAAFQAQKYKPRGVLLTYAFLILLGFSFNRITDPGFLKEVEFDIIQMVAVGSSAVYLLEYYLRPRVWIYFLLGALAFGFKFILQFVFAGVSISGLTNLFFPPGIFPIFPWLFLFFFGLFAYRIDNYVNLGLALGFGALLFSLRQINIALDLENKWDMSFGYFLACSILLFAAFFVLRAIPFFQQRRNGLLTFLGKNSLLFLYVHFPIILYLKEIRIHRASKLIFQHPYLFWILVLGLTLIAMFVLIWLAKWKVAAQVFSRLSVWIAMALLVFAVGILIPSERWTYVIEIGLGILTALFYPQLGNMFKQKIS